MFTYPIMRPPQSATLILQYLSFLLTNFNDFHYYNQKRQADVNLAPYLNCFVALYLTKCRTKYQLFLRISTTKYGVFEEASRIEQVIYGHCEWVHVLEMSALRMNAYWTSFTLVKSHVAIVLVKIAPDLNQPLFQFTYAVHDCMVNGFLNSNTYLIVNWVEIWAVWRLKMQWNKKKIAPKDVNTARWLK